MAGIVTSRFNTVRPGERFQASNILASSVTESWQFEESLSVGIGISGEVSGEIWEEITGAIGIDLSLDSSITVRRGMKFTSGDCPGDAVVYWHPLYDYYDVMFNDGSREDVWISINLNGYAAGKWGTDCIR